MPRIIDADEPQCLSRRAQPDLYFGAHRHELDLGAQGLDEKRVALMAAVEANLLTEEACGYANADRPLTWRSLRRGRHSMIFYLIPMQPTQLIEIDVASAQHTDDLRTRRQPD